MYAAFRSLTFSQSVAGARYDSGVASQFANVSTRIAVVLLLLVCTAQSVVHLHLSFFNQRWHTDDWTDFTQQAAASLSNTNAPVSFDGFPGLRKLAELHSDDPAIAAEYQDWLKARVKVFFTRQQRETAYVYKGFLTCVGHGNCLALTDYLPGINAGAESFVPTWNTSWVGGGQPAGTIDWEESRFGGYGRLVVQDEYWSAQAGAYIVSGKVRSDRGSADAAPHYSPLELRFYSPCSFAGMSGGPCFVGDNNSTLAMDTVVTGHCRQ